MRPNETRINDGIRAPEVRVIDEEGQQLGLMPPHEAIRIAESRGLDLVEVAGGANPPVCRIMDYGKYKFMEAKREHAARAKQKSIVVKEVKFRPKTDDHDFDFKVRHIERFLEDGFNVKVVVMFRGREVVHRDIGYRIIEDVINRVSDKAKVDKGASIEGRDMHAFLAPKPVDKKLAEKKAKATKPDQAAAEPAPAAPEAP
ncbi:MAG TPA: translation initiation factor IF-3 [Holophagaceae bacterium]|nr:translation initiation factor IF-3 [Holophagaceae bacterium]